MCDFFLSVAPRAVIATVECGVSAVWRLHEIYGNCEIYERGMGASLYTPRVYLPQIGMARAKMCRRGGLIGAPNKNLVFLIFLVFLVFLASAARRV